MRTQQTGNPITAARAARGLTRIEFGLLAGRTLSAVTAVENGHVATMPESWRSGLEAAGFDFDELAAAYKAWLGERAVAARAAAGQGLAANG